MKIFITGADGFIGSHLTEKLLKAGHKVKALSYYNSFNSIGWLKEVKNNTKNFIQEKCQSMGLKKIRVISLNQNTLGQADTVYKGLKLDKASQTEAMTIFNIDTFRPNFIFPKDLDLKKTDGYLEVFEGTGSNWSYVRPQIDSDRIVAETAEKKIISNLCDFYFTDSNRRSYLAGSNHNSQD